MTADPPATMTAAEYLAWQAAQEQRRRSKYGAVPVVIDGERFDSTGEGNRWCELRRLQDAGAIRDLRRQVRYPMEVNGVKVAEYVADFTYHEEWETPLGPLWWRFVVEDYKSPATRTPLYRLKKRLMKALYNIEIRETGR